MSYLNSAAKVASKERTGIWNDSFKPQLKLFRDERDGGPSQVAAGECGASVDHKEVAERAGVSIGTASNVLNGVTRVSKARAARVLAAVKELDYHPNEVARSLKVKQTKMLGMVLPDITNPFFSDIICGAENAALERGYLLLTANTDEQEEREKRFVAALQSRRVDGILLAATASKSETHLKSVVAAGIPIVCLDRTAAGLAVDAVLADNVSGTQECIRHILRLGHSAIAIITGSLELQIARERLGRLPRRTRRRKASVMRRT